MRKDETSCCFCCSPPHSAYLLRTIPILNPIALSTQLLFCNAAFLPSPLIMPLVTLNTPLAFPSRFLSLAGLEAVSVVFMRPLPLSCTILLFPPKSYDRRINYCSTHTTRLQNAAHSSSSLLCWHVFAGGQTNIILSLSFVCLLLLLFKGSICTRPVHTHSHPPLSTL
ncbi:MAG: hypothetical protein JOS17DRAFT_335265 [Linnemannia elongata]|nr:MAG: hypothetical protein JOS17DRAFT_335265 [Linnemannia elongata]